jgi:hypothetical protein
MKLAHKLKKQCMNHPEDGSPYFDWLSMGKEASICFNTVPSRVRFWANVGPPAVKAPRKARGAKQTKEAGPEVRPEDIDNKAEKSADALSATEQTIKDLKSTLGKRTDEESSGSGEVEGVRFLFNPKSFTQTVENIFHFSFLLVSIDIATCSWTASLTLLGTTENWPCPN